MLWDTEFAVWGMAGPDEAMPASDDGQGQAGVESSQVVGVAGDDTGAGSAGADDDVGVCDVAGAAGAEQAPDARRVHPVEWDHVGPWLTQQPGEPSLPPRIADRLGERAGRDGDAAAGLLGSCEQDDHSTVGPVQLNQGAGVERHPVAHAAVPAGPVRPRTSSAQRCSSLVIAPPVSVSA